jgi:hypothetical protein
MLSPNEVANIDDYMPLPIIPVVTNEHQSTTENVDTDHCPEQEQPMLENFAQNGLPMILTVHQKIQKKRKVALK